MSGKALGFAAAVYSADRGWTTIALIAARLEGHRYKLWLKSDPSLDSVN